MKSLKSLIITTSNNRLGDTNKKTGVWLEDLAAPYFILKDSGERITIASPQGGLIPLDPNCQSIKGTTGNTVRFQQDAQAMYHFSHSLSLNEVKPQEFDLIFIAGGYGAMWDFSNNRRLQQIIQHFNLLYRPIGLVGHAAVALVSLIKDNGEPFVKGRKLTAFSDSEEYSGRFNEKAPFLLESKLRSLGALYSKGPDFKSYVVTDENMITGQNPSSSVETAKQLLSLAYSQCRKEHVYINPSS
jgi:putative intracellular protease/amidase